MTKISVIIPACNEEKYIGKTLDSLRKQTMTYFETIVVCNGCTDRTNAIAKKYHAQVLELEEAQVSQARNLGAQHSSGELLVFLDADTVLEPDALEKIRRGFREEYAVATTLLQPDQNKIHYDLAVAFKNFYNQQQWYAGCSGVLVCRKKDFVTVGGYDSSLKVREHRKLILQLKKLGKYKTITTTATTSMRRYDQWGIPKILSFWTGQWLKDHFSDLSNSEYKVIR